MDDALVQQTRQQSLGDLPRRTARRVPDKLAIVDGRTRLTFAELDAVVDRAAAALADTGLAKGDRLALLCHNSWQFAVLDFACARAGVVLVPVNFMLGGDEVAFILDHSGATAFVVEDALLPVAEAAIAASGGSVEHRAVVRLAGDAHAVPDGWVDLQQWLDHDGTPPAVLVGDDDPVRMMFTSGTESRPKGALLSSRSLLWQYVSCAVDGSMSADDVELHTLPLYHCAQLDCFLGVDVYLGATSVILPGPDPAAILRAIEEHRVTKFFAPPTVWIGLLRHPDFDAADLSSLRKGYYGASPMPVEILREIQRRLPDVALWNFYGQTEMAPLASALRPDEQAQHSGAAGHPVPNVETAILDDQDQPVPPGRVGEIAHRSPHLMLGYLDDPLRTAEAFRGGWFHSGDLGYYDDFGLLHVVDRKKDMIKTGGENVASVKVEAAVLAHPGVAGAAVLGLPHPHWGEAVCAFVVAKPGTAQDEAALLAHCRERLGGFEVPKLVRFVDALPATATGKVQKHVLRRQFEQLAAEAWAEAGTAS